MFLAIVADDCTNKTLKIFFTVKKCSCRENAFLKTHTTVRGDSQLIIFLKVKPVTVSSKVFLSLSLSLSFFIQLLHILTENLQSPGTISLEVSRNQPAKICSKVN